MVDFAIHSIWIAFPVFFFSLALWNKLELMSGKGKSEDVKNFFSQGVFVTICVILAFIIDAYFLESIASLFPDDLFPLWFFRVILLPFIFLIGAKVVGPSKEIRILRAPKPVGNRSKRKR